MAILQIRDKFLRLSTEQVHHIVNGIVLQREEIDIDSIPIYDSEMNNVIEQLEQQGVYVKIEPPTPAEDISDMQKAQVVVAELYSMAMSVPTDQKQPLFNKLQELERILFGE